MLVATALALIVQGVAQGEGSQGIQTWGGWTHEMLVLQLVLQNFDQQLCNHFALQHLMFHWFCLGRVTLISFAHFHLLYI